jgi:membrane-anchored protein YejM (alkaline phosphatase superfamily)
MISHQRKGFPLLTFLVATAVAQIMVYGVLAQDFVAGTGVTRQGVGLGYLVSWAIMADGVVLLVLCVLRAAVARWMPAGRRHLTVVTLALLLTTLLNLFLVLDAALYLLLGLHLVSPAVVDLLGQSGLWAELSPSASLVMWLAISVLVVVAIQLALAFGLHRLHNGCLQTRRRWLDRLAVTLVLAFATGALAVHQVRPDRATLNLSPWHAWSSNKPSDQPPPVLAYPQKGLAWPRLDRPRSVLIVVADSFRDDVLTPALSPHTHAFAVRHPHCFRPTRHYSGSHTTQYGIFSLLYGLNSPYYESFRHSATPSWPLEVFKHNGYTVAGAVSSRFRDWGGARFMAEQFRPYAEFSHIDPPGNEEALVEWTSKFQRERDPAKPFFLFLFLTSTHHNYYYPPEFERHMPSMPVGYNHFLPSKELEGSRDAIFNRYRNSVMYVDDVFARVRTIFRQDIDAGKLAVVFTGDHGEEFWDHGRLGHSAPHFVKARIQVPLLMCLPGLAPPAVALSSHTDVMPTLLQYNGMTPSVSSQTFSDGVPLFGAADPDRQVIAAAQGFPRSPTLALMANGQKWWLRRTGSVPARELRAHQRHLAGQPTWEVERQSNLDDSDVSGDAALHGERLKRLDADLSRFYR